MTTRQSSFDFTTFHLIYKSIYQTQDKISDEFLQWFIGFSEGDGSLITSKFGVPCFVITQKEPDCSHYIVLEIN